MKKITPAMMADAMGVPVQAIRVGIQKGALDFGVAVQQTGQRYTYIIFPEKAKQILGSEKLQEWGY